jgi:hypothetical protein
MKVERDLAAAHELFTDARTRRSIEDDGNGSDRGAEDDDNEEQHPDKDGRA